MFFNAVYNMPKIIFHSFKVQFTKKKKEFCDSFEFLDQHKATLNELHREIDRLKLQNKDQQWRLVLNGAASPTEVLQETVSCHSLFTTNQNSRNSGQHEVENVRRRK